MAVSGHESIKEARRRTKQALGEGPCVGKESLHITKVFSECATSRNLAVVASERRILGCGRLRKSTSLKVLHSSERPNRLERLQLHA